MKTKLLSYAVVAVLMGLGVSSTVSAQEAVTNVNDVGTMITKGAWQSANIAKYIEQIAVAKAQQAIAQQGLNALTGSRGLGSLSNNQSLNNAIPSQWSSLYSGAGSSNLQGLTSQISKMVSTQQTAGSTDLQNLTNRQGNDAAVDYAVGSNSQTSAIARQNQVQSLIGQINSTNDPKSIAELQARLAGEQAAIATEQQQLSAASMQQQAQQRNEQAIADTAWQNELKARGSIGELPDSVSSPAQ